MGTSDLGCSPVYDFKLITLISWVVAETVSLVYKAGSKKRGTKNCCTYWYSFDILPYKMGMNRNKRFIFVTKTINLLLLNKVLSPSIFPFSCTMMWMIGVADLLLRCASLIESSKSALYKSNKSSLYSFFIWKVKKPVFKKFKWNAVRSRNFSWLQILSGYIWFYKRASSIWTRTLGWRWR